MCCASLESWNIFNRKADFFFGVSGFTFPLKLACTCKNSLDD